MHSIMISSLPSTIFLTCPRRLEEIGADIANQRAQARQELLAGPSKRRQLLRRINATKDTTGPRLNAVYRCREQALADLKFSDIPPPQISATVSAPTTSPPLGSTGRTRTQTGSKPFDRAICQPPPVAVLEWSGGWRGGAETPAIISGAGPGSPVAEALVISRSLAEFDRSRVVPPRQIPESF